MTAFDKILYGALICLHKITKYSLIFPQCIRALMVAWSYGLQFLVDR